MTVPQLSSWDDISYTIEHVRYTSLNASIDGGLMISKIEMIYENIVSVKRFKTNTIEDTRTVRMQGEHCLKQDAPNRDRLPELVGFVQTDVPVSGKRSSHSDDPNRNRSDAPVSHDGMCTTHSDLCSRPSPPRNVFTAMYVHASFRITHRSRAQV